MLEHIEIALRALKSVDPSAAPAAARIGVAHDLELAIRMAESAKTRLVEAGK